MCKIVCIVQTDCHAHELIVSALIVAELRLQPLFHQSSDGSL